ncbi:MAG: Holliday junction resolvase RuvX [Planctomycetota bacterium]
MTNSVDFPSTGRLAAVDYGTVRTGIAICDPDWILASPWSVIDARAGLSDASAFVELAKTEQIVGWVVGLPIHCDGNESQKSVDCRVFARWLRDETRLPTRLFDERFTTVAANQRLRLQSPTRKQKRQRLDAVAAQILLESFIEACRYHGTIAGTDAGAAPRGDMSLD